MMKTSSCQISNMVYYNTKAVIFQAFSQIVYTLAKDSQNVLGFSMVMVYNIMVVYSQTKGFLMIIDFHTHCFPDALAPRAIGQLTETISSLHIRPSTDGTVAGLISNMERSGIDQSVVCNIATNARQMRKVNDFAIFLKAQYPEKLIPLGSLHPHAEGLAEELNRLMAAGIHGIKLHPDYVNIDFDAPDFEEILTLCEANNVFVITHAGFDPLSPDHFHCTPAMVCRVLDKHPALKLVVAHMGGLHCEAESLSLLCGRDVYLDTSLMTHRPEKAALLYKILQSHAPNRLLFATDTPWTDAREEVSSIRTAPLSEELKTAVFSNNALSLLASCQFDI